MSFAKYNESGELIRNRVVVDCSKDELLTEQNHKDEVNINNIIRRHGIDLITKTAMLKAPDMHFDDVTGNDFQEAMFKVTKARQTFESMPSAIRKEFDNNPARFMDFVQNPDNSEAMIEMGLSKAPIIEQPIEVIITNPEPASEPVPDA